MEMPRITVSAKALQGVRQIAKELHTRNAVAYIAKGALYFEVVGDNDKRTIKLEDIKTG